MVKAQVDTTNESEFFTSRSLLKRPRAAKKEEVITTALLETGKKKRRTKGNAYQHTKTGARSDLGGLVVRSNWEANFIRVLNMYRIAYEFEPTKFIFPPSQRTGISPSYIPDFYLPDTDEYVEIKGYLDARGRNKLRKFRKHYPEEFSKLAVVISRTNKANLLFFNKLGVEKILFYENISQLYAAKTNWEGKQ